MAAWHGWGCRRHEENHTQLIAEDRCDVDQAGEKLDERSMRTKLAALLARMNQEC